ncbi:MAG: type VI secretion system membrane subunit TssM [Burkholderiaceae bacterium]|jgi:type VI secretion system protein ImpL|nr:type VI secretion system membrane subunit TssM [Burkholderiaceae bacterium]
MYFFRRILYFFASFFRLAVNRTTLVLLGLVALCAFIWFSGPLFAYGESRPLASERARWNVIITVFVLFLIWWLMRFWRRRNLNAKFLDQLAKIAARPVKEKIDPSGKPQKPREVEELQERFAQALNSIKSLHASKGSFNRLSGRYIYELPWYLIIGAPGSGKTTALVNSGLNFPLEEITGRAALKGVGGTRNCDWWITDEAVIIDTAGRYTTQDSHAEVDKTEWRGFLGLLKKYRPRQPINGVILTLSIADVLAFSRDERDAHYNTLKARLAELQESFGIELPVYLWITKTDLLAGFSEFFDSYSTDPRKQVWGFTFKYQEENRTQNIVESFDHEWALLQDRLYRLQDEQLAKETESRRLSAIYGLPQQLAGLQTILREAIEIIFRQSKQVARPLLRGLYFSSGTQEGTPFDRILSTLRRNFPSSRTADFRIVPNQGKSYFLYDLFSSLIFKETHLAGRNIRWERKVKWLTYAGYVASVLVLAIAVGAWIISYKNNESYLADVGKDVQKLSAAISSYPQGDGDMESMIALLEQAQHLGDTSAFPRAHPNLPYRYGLYQGSKVSVTAEATYEHLLKDGLLPIIAKRLESQVQRPPVETLEYLFEALKCYLMLYEAEHYDPEYLRRWVSADARRYLMPDADADTLERMDTHLAKLINKDRIITSVFPINDDLLAQARKKLETLTTAQRVYSRLRAQLETVDLPAFNLLDAAGPQAANIFTRRSKLPLNRGVSGLFTYQGYWDVFDKEVGKASAEMADDEAWVLGLPGKTDKTQIEEATRGKLVREVRMVYLREYADTWDQYLNDIQLIPSDSLQTSIQQMRVLSAPDSPLPLFLKAVVKETTLLRDNLTGDQRSLFDRAKQRLKNTRNEIERVVGPLTIGAPDRKLEHIVDDRFEPIRQLVGPPGAPPTQQAPIDATLKMLDQYYGTLVAANAAIRSGDRPPSQESVISLRAEAARLPQPLRGMINQATASSIGQTTHLVRASIGTNLNSTVGDFCRRAIAGRYPLRRSGTSDVTPEDFAHLFAPNGLMDDFFHKNLSSIVDTSTWTFKKNIDGSWAGGSGSLASFKTAAVIRDVFFRTGDRMPSVRLAIKPVEMDPTILSMSLDVDGSIVRYSHGPQLAQSLTWPGPNKLSYVLLEITGQDFNGVAIKTEGPWALHRFFDKLSVSSRTAPERFLATATIQGKKIVFEVTTNSVQNPFRLRELDEFSCPTQF